MLDIKGIEPPPLDINQINQILTKNQTTKDQPLISLKTPINQKSKMSGHPPAKKIGKNNQRITQNSKAVKNSQSNRSRNSSKSGDSGKYSISSDNFAPLANLGGLGGFPTVLMSESEREIVDKVEKNNKDGWNVNYLDAKVGKKVGCHNEVKRGNDPKLQAGMKPVVRNINQPR